MQENPHNAQPIYRAGASIEQANSALILIHGRGATAQSMFSLGQAIAPQSTVLLAPQATMNTWYPQRFIMSRAHNEPWLSSALELVDKTVQLALDAGMQYDKIAIAGFSQGACLTSEYIARHPKQYAAAMILSGGLIGAEGELTDYSGDLQQTPVFFGCSDVDFHIPVERVHESATILQNLNASVETRIYQGMGHTVNEDEIAYMQNMLKVTL